MNKEAQQKIFKLLIIIVLLFAILATAVWFIQRNLTGASARVVEDTEWEDDDYNAELVLTLDDTAYTTDHVIDTWLFVGTDGSGNEAANGTDEYEGAQADFLNLLIVDHTAETYAILAINRESMTLVPIIGDDGTASHLARMQICTAHGLGTDLEMSAENTVNTVSSFLGELPIDGSFVLPMDEIAEINSLLGGVTVTIEGDLTAANPAFTDGATITLTDEQAEKFVRTRMEVGEGINSERMARQKQYLTGVKEKLSDTLAENPEAAISIFDTLKEYAVTDINGKTISKLANYLSKYEDLGTFEFEGEQTVGQALADGLDHDEFYVYDESKTAVMTELFSLKEE